MKQKGNTKKGVEIKKEHEQRCASRVKFSVFCGFRVFLGVLPLPTVT